MINCSRVGDYTYSVNVGTFCDDVNLDKAHKSPSNKTSEASASMGTFREKKVSEFSRPTP